MYHISAAVGSSCVQGTVFCDDVGSHLVPIWSAAGSPTAGGREQGYGRAWDADALFSLQEKLRRVGPLKVLQIFGCDTELKL